MDVERVDTIAAAAFTDAVAIRAAIGILEESNAPDVRASLGEATLAAHVLRQALFQRIVMTATRVYAREQKGDYHARVAIDALRASPRLLSQVVAAGGNRELLLLAIHEFDEACADPRHDSIRTSRNKLAAHLSDWDERYLEPVILDLFSFAARTASVCERLAQGVGIRTLKAAEHAAPIISSARALWRGAAGERSPP